MDTALSRGLYAAGADVQYDDNAKHILGHKTVIAHILARTASEFQGIDPKEIVPLIEAEPQIDEIHVLPGETNKHLPFVSGQNAEIAIPGEGRNTFDVRFYVWTPDRRGRIKLLVE